MKTLKSAVKKELVQELRTLALEAHTLAVQIDELGLLDTLEKRLLQLPEMIELLKQAAWEAREGKFELASEIISRAKDIAAQERLDSIQEKI
ncbi:MAG: hypothetical protein KME40_32060 [Komarekiella atlantica HA4396-MV6]|jgi:hypothetical protein|nr:hypothetical protein [Komarekiella atlantica HA4396-MV6]